MTTLASYLPPKVRAVVYAVLGFINTVVLGLLAMGVISDATWFAVALLVANAAGFTIAHGNVPTAPAVPHGETPQE